MVRGLEHLSNKCRLREVMALGSLQYLNGAFRRAGAGLFTRACSGRARGNCIKPKED